jgi:hypothetical protein
LLYKQKNQHIDSLLYWLELFRKGLTLIKGNYQKTFKEGFVFEIVNAEKPKSKDADCCNYTQLTGKIYSIEGDSITLQLFSVSNKKVIDGTENEHIYFSQTGMIKSTIAWDQIYYLRNFKNYKNINRKTNFQIIGAILMVTGAVTMLNSFIVDTRSNKNKLLYTGGAQIGLGLGFSILGSTKKYFLHHTNNNWVFKQ